MVEMKDKMEQEAGVNINWEIQTYYQETGKKHKFHIVLEEKVN